MDGYAIFWLAAVIVFAVAEACTVQLICVWFGVASLVSLVANLLGIDFWAQVVIFAVASAALLIASRPLAKKLARKPTATNADRAIGATAVVIEPLSDSAGLVKVGGQVWSARTTSGTIPVGAHVKVLAIEGVKLIVNEYTETTV
ncbi:MAG: NfeD family protein [Oscillospiraceae bacterium]|jgi:membrane protein implicated in regulation of membrane protease activity|nr:NfeD family protein [Oscillospiraceae bacterium]